MTPQTVYKSTHPKVLAAYDESIERHKEWVAAVQAFAARWPDHKPLQSRYPGRVYIVGLDGVERPGPEWRFDKKLDRWVADKRTGAGKALAKEIEALSVRGIGVLPGMPNEVFGPGHLYSHGLDVWDRTVWAAWSCGADLLAEVDLTVWEPGKLSEYYAAKERHSDGRDAGQESGDL